MVMPRFFTTEDYACDGLAYETVYNNIGKYFIMNPKHEEDYGIDCTLYSKKTNKKIMYLELEMKLNWKEGSDFPFNTIHCLKHKVDKYSNMDCLSLYLIFSADLKHVQITIFDEIKTDYPQFVSCRNGLFINVFYDVSKYDWYTKTIAVKDLEKVLASLYLSYYLKKD